MKSAAIDGSVLDRSFMLLSMLSGSNMNKVWNQCDGLYEGFNLIKEKQITNSFFLPRHKSYTNRLQHLSSIN